MQRNPVRLTPYRILTLDGGGIRGLISAVALERLQYAVPGWLEQVDLIAGTSVGGIIALGLAYGLGPADLRRLLYHKASLIFADSIFDDLVDLGRFIGADYDIGNLRREIGKIVGDTRLSELRKRVLVPAVDLDNEASDPARRHWKPKFFHNFPGSDSDGDRRVVDVALYTSAAPTYFAATDGFIDGGVVVNNPSMAAVVQTQDQRAHIDQRPALADIVLLSVGTGRPPLFVPGQTLDWGVVQWIRPLLNLFTDGVTGVADFQCRQLLRERYHRVEPVFPAGQSYSIDDWRKRDALVDFAQNLDLEATIDWLRQNWA